MLYYGVLETYPKLQGLIELKRENDQLSDLMPLPNLKARDLSWQGNLLPLQDEPEDREARDGDRPVDWDEVCMMHASRTIHEIRSKVLQTLKFTCSAGISTNKVLAKLCSGYEKPNKQTVLRVGAVSRFLAPLNFAKFRGLGGKLGDSISQHFNVPAEASVPFLLEISKAELVRVLGDETGSWLYDILRGRDFAEVKIARPESKSMMSAKNFRPSIHSTEEAVPWLHTFVADIASRIVEFANTATDSGGVRLPKTLVIHSRHAKQVSHSRQLPLPPCTLATLSETLLTTALTLYKHIEKEKEKSMYPMLHLSLGVSGFDSSVAKNQAIDSFLIRGSGPEKLSRQRTTTNDKESPSKKKGIAAFLGSSDRNSSEPPPDTPQSVESTFICEVCHTIVSIADVEEHHDWHYAQNLMRQMQEEDDNTNVKGQASKRKATSSGGQQKKSAKVEKGQQKLFNSG